MSDLQYNDKNGLENEDTRISPNFSLEFLFKYYFCVTSVYVCFFIHRSNIASKSEYQVNCEFLKRRIIFDFWFFTKLSCLSFESTNWFKFILIKTNKYL